jgi:hypothetical protein
MEALTSDDFALPKPRIILWDIETAPNRSFTWGKWQQNVIEFDAEWYMLAWSVKVLGGKQVTKCLADYEGYKPNTEDDRALVTELWHQLNGANVYIFHNGRKFDLKKANTRFIELGLKPIAPKPMIDTLTIARRQFAFNSNKLDDLGRRLGVGRKAQTGGFELWRKCMEGDAKAWGRMKKYCGQDVRLLEAVYEKMKPFIDDHPHLGVMQGLTEACRNCAGSNLVKKGTRPTKTGRRQMYQCVDCGSWMQGRHQTVTQIR